MANHGSALLRKQKSRTLDANLKRRARKLTTDSRVDPRTRLIDSLWVAGQRPRSWANSESGRGGRNDHSL